MDMEEGVSDLSGKLFDQSGNTSQNYQLSYSRLYIPDTNVVEDLKILNIGDTLVEALDGHILPYAPVISELSRSPDNYPINQVTYQVYQIEGELFDDALALTGQRSLPNIDDIAYEIIVPKGKEPPSLTDIRLAQLGISIREYGGVILSNDWFLRTLAKRGLIENHGTLYIMGQHVAKGLWDPQRYLESYKHLSSKKRKIGSERDRDQVLKAAIKTQILKI